MDHCKTCGHKCCRGEQLFTSPQEPVVGHNPDGDCVNLASGVGCLNYATRLVECRMFPVDLQYVRGALWWVLWDCPLSRAVDSSELLEQAIETVARSGGPVYATSYVEHHERVRLPQYQQGFRLLSLYHSTV